MPTSRSVVLRRARVDAINTMIPDLGHTKEAEDLHHGAIDLEDGYVLRRAREKEVRALRDCEAEAFRALLPAAPRGEDILVRRWARLRIPIGQICNSAWKELNKPLEKRRTARKSWLSKVRQRLHVILFYL